MVQADLWGNATVGSKLQSSPLDSETDVQDLSLLVDLKYEDLQKLQAVGAKAQEEQAKFILRNDLPRVWELLKKTKNGRMDFVMDNGASRTSLQPDLLNHAMLIVTAGFEVC